MPNLVFCKKAGTVLFCKKQAPYFFVKKQAKNFLVRKKCETRLWFCLWKVLAIALGESNCKCLRANAVRSYHTVVSLLQPVGETCGLLSYNALWAVPGCNYICEALSFVRLCRIAPRNAFVGAWYTVPKPRPSVEVAAIADGEDCWDRRPRLSDCDL